MNYQMIQLACQYSKPKTQYIPIYIKNVLICIHLHRYFAHLSHISNPNIQYFILYPITHFYLFNLFIHLIHSQHSYHSTLTSIYTKCIHLFILQACRKACTYNPHICLYIYIYMYIYIYYRYIPFYPCPHCIPQHLYLTPGMGFQTFYSFA